jgi:hypothetical protein
MTTDPKARPVSQSPATRGSEGTESAERRIGQQEAREALYVKVQRRDLATVLAFADNGSGMDPATELAIRRLSALAEFGNIAQQSAAQQSEGVRPVGSVPEGWALVPQSMYVDGDTYDAMFTYFGENVEGEGRADCEFFVGESEGDDGEKYYGLHIRMQDYPEEGCSPIVEFAPPSEAAPMAAQHPAPESDVPAGDEWVGELLPCPFCNNASISEFHEYECGGKDFVACCDSCGARVSTGDALRTAAAWNRRFPSPSAQGVSAVAAKLDTLAADIAQAGIKGFGNACSDLAAELRAPGVSDAQCDAALFASAIDEHGEPMAMLIDFMDMGTTEQLPKARLAMRAALKAALVGILDTKDDTNKDISTDA